MFSKAVALECAQNDDRIRVNTVFPSGVISPMWESMEFWKELRATAGSDEAAWKVMAQAVPLKRFAEPEEIAQAILYLATDEAGFVTGADFVIDGGFTA
jgi:NAD(P)-dependent dehydrogenase (short-subunit alcohol dehydrogenase family)